MAIDFYEEIKLLENLLKREDFFQIECVYTSTQEVEIRKKEEKLS